MSTYHVELVRRDDQPAAVVRGHVEPAEIPAFLGGAFEEVLRVLADQHRSPVGPPFGRFHPVGGGFDAAAGFPASGPVTPVGRVNADMLPGGPAATVLHRGDYGGVAAAYEAASAWLASNGYVAAGEPWESYLDEPGVAQPRTIVSLPCRPA